MTSAKVLIGSEKQSTLEFLTNGEVDRLENNTRAITFALIPFLQENLYFQ